MIVMTHKGTIILETERLILRRFTLEDLEQIYYNCWSDEEVWKWTNYKPMNSTQDVKNNARMFTEEWLGAYDNPNRYSWAIQLKNSGEVIGRFFGMHPDDQISQIELAYELGRNWWNQGFMTEAVKVVIDFFFNDIGFNRIYANHAIDNPASGKVMRKCGMTYEGTMRQACKCNYGLFDKVNYAILAEEYIKRIKGDKI
jgi:ribosomal-protein-alanine N-acetyltransferase